MKTKIIYVAIVTLLMGCSSGASKFIGKWQPVKPSYMNNAELQIEKQNDQFVMTNSKNPDKPVILNYVEKQEVLTGSVEGYNVNVAFSDSSQHLLLKPFADSDPIEYQKAQ